MKKFFLLLTILLFVTSCSNKKPYEGNELEAPEFLKNELKNIQ